jgi:SAM-dependent methyltransferase
VKDDARLLDAHYGSDDLPERIAAALPDGPIDRARLAALDEFHSRGLEATREVAAMAGLAPGMRVLDLGCGLGGPARTFAAEYGCRVDGVEIVDGFCRAAAMLNERTGLAGRVMVHRADVRALPFANEVFDRAGTMHTLLNVPDPATVLREVRRVLNPGGRFFFYEIVRTGDEPLDYPVPWTPDSSLDATGTEKALRGAIDEAGLTVEVLEDATEATLAWFDRLTERMASAPGTRPQGPNLGLVMGPDAGLKSRNLRRNLEFGLIRVVRGLATLFPERV